jgi:superfamily II DNA or RNA helicase
MAKLNVQDFANDFSVVIVDECHKAAGSPTRIMQFYKVITALKARHKYGLSATMHRADGLIASTKAILGPVVVSISDEEIGEKIIKSNYVEIPTVLPDSEYYLNFDGTLDHNKLIEYIVYHEGRNQQIKKIIQENPERNILVLSHRVHHLEILQNIIQRPSHLLVGNVNKNRRAEILEEIKSTAHGNIMLSTYSLAKEGLDIPNLDMLILATPHKDKAIVLQSVGRIERNFVGKPKPIVCDLVDNYIFYCKKIAKTRKNLIINR